jgi:uncharacterized protein (DUF58 family)
MSATESAATGEYLLAPGFLRKLEQAAVTSRHIVAGRTKGERRSARRGSSVEFADFRAYTPGDDLRYLDWNAYARLERLFLKLFLEEEDLHVYVLLDASESMGFGAPAKLRWGLEMAGALSYMTLCSGDRAQVYAQHDGQGDRSRLLRGRGAAPELLGWLSALQPGGGTDLPGLVEWFLRTAGPPGVVFVISDLLTPGWPAAINRLAAARGSGCVLQVLAPEELEPALQGDLRLLDAETAEPCEVTMGVSVLRRYRQERDRFLAEARAACHRYGLSYLLSSSADPVEEVVLRSLRRLGVVK